MSVFGECGRGSVQLMAEHHKCKYNNDKHRNKEDEWPRNLSYKYEWNMTEFQVHYSFIESNIIIIIKTEQDISIIPLL